MPLHRSLLCCVVLFGWGVARSTAASVGTVEPSGSWRLGYDSNPLGTGGASAAVLGERSAWTSTLGVGLGVALGSGPRTLKLAYAAEATGYEGLGDEDFSTHRLSVVGRFEDGGWKFSADGSVLLIAGSHDTLPAVTTANANATTLWRERRAQVQTRLKLQAERSAGAWVTRLGATLLAYDYHTHVRAGYVAFADRRDGQAALDLGWNQTAKSRWIAGVRPGHQDQAIVPLPNCAFDYSNDYVRVAAGWEGQLTPTTTLSFAAGPDFRRYNGTVDSRVFTGGPDRTASWGEASLVAKPNSRLTLTAKAARMNWLSSTGKAAYIDTCAETTVAFKADAKWTLRASLKVHACDFFPAPRDDWEALTGFGCTYQATPTLQFTVDALHHRAWNELPTTPDRAFTRNVMTLGASLRL